MYGEISIETNTFAVNGTQASTEKGIEITSPKSKASKREIPIPPFLKDRINE